MDREFVYKMVTDRVTAMIEQGVIPWHRPWKFQNVEGDGHDCAISYVTRKPYSLINQWLLTEPGEYLTFNQVKALGGTVKKGEKSRFVVFFTQVPYTKKNEQGEDEVHTYPLLKYYNVFHVNQTEGVQSKLEDLPEEPAGAFQMDEAAEKAIADYVRSQETLTFVCDKPSNRAYYCATTDTVVVPMRSQYNDDAEYYSTVFHEMTHSTMTEERCNRRDRNTVAFFGSKEYSREELVAEIGAAMLCANFNVDTEKAFRNSVAYLQSWVKNLKNDPKAIVTAAGKAEKAARYILGERSFV